MKLGLIIKGLFALAALVNADSVLTESDIVVNMKRYVERYGYQFEEYLLNTDDGYKVTLQRISSATGVSKNGPPVLLMHGHEGSSADFLLNWPERSPALMLVEHGYDVWLGNNRGNAYSKGHVHLDRQADKDAYWNFGIEELGLYDVPTFIDEILKHNSYKKLEAYIGHELGNTQFFAASSLRPDYFDQKVNLFIAFAPLAESHRSISWLDITLGEFFNFFRWWNQAIVGYDWEEEQNQRLQKGIDCENQLQWCIFWNQFSFNFQLNAIERLPMFFAHSNMGSSWKVYEHLFEIAKEQKFIRYDYGAFKNNELYKQSDPPKYDLTKIRNKKILLYGV